MGESGFLKSFLKGRSDEKTVPEDIGAEHTRAEKSADMEQNPDSGTGPVEDAQMAATPAGDGNQELKARVIDALSQIYDPEIPVNIYELGLIYDVKVGDNDDIHVVMTLTTPHCPVAESMPGEVETRVRDVEGVNDVNVELVWDPPWDMTMMSEAARLELGFM